MGREAKIHNKLTPKQDSFVKGILSGKTPTQSAIVAYNVSSSKSASVIASQNLNKLSIKEVLDEALSSRGLSLSVITSNLGDLANSKPEKVSGDTVLKANVELLKLHGAYPDKKSSHVSFNYQAQMKARLENMSIKEIQEETRKLEAEIAEIMEDTKTGYTPKTI